MDPYKTTVGPPVYPFADHRDNWAMFTIETAQDDDGTHVARIEAGGKTFEARHRYKDQAVNDVQRAVEDARARGDIYPGVF